MQMAGLSVMERRLGPLGEPYSQGAAKAFKRAAQVLTLAGTAAVGARNRAVAIAGGTALTAGVVCERWSVFRAGFQSAADPKYVVGPQRARLSA